MLYIQGCDRSMRPGYASSQASAMASNISGFGLPMPCMLHSWITSGSKMYSMCRLRWVGGGSTLQRLDAPCRNPREVAEKSAPSRAARRDGPVPGAVGVVHHPGPGVPQGLLHGPRRVPQLLAGLPVADLEVDREGVHRVGREERPPSR